MTKHEEGLQPARNVRNGCWRWGARASTTVVGRLGASHSGSKDEKEQEQDSSQCNEESEDKTSKATARKHYKHRSIN